MRTSKTFILRLLVDSECPDQLKGMLEPIGEKAQPFHSDAALLALLKPMVTGQLVLGKEIRGKSNPPSPD